MNHQDLHIWKLCRTLLVTFITWPLLCLVLFVFTIYRKIIDIILNLKIGKLYGGLFDHSDMFLCIPNSSKCSVTSVLYVKSNKEVNLFHIIRKTIKKKVFDHPEFYPKLTSAKYVFSGYPFWIKNGCKLDDVIHPLKIHKNIVFDEEYLKEATAKISSSEYPKNGRILWDIHVSEQPLRISCQDSYYRYPLVFRFHHAIADGTSLIALLIRWFGDETAQNYSEGAFKKLVRRAHHHRNQKSAREIIKYYVVKCIKTIWLCLNMLIFSVGRVIESHQLRPKDVHALHNSRLSGDKNVAWVAEDNIECVPLVKQIKNRTNTNFISVMCTAVAASFTDYFRRNSLPIPDYTSGGVAMLLDSPTVDHSKPVKLENKTTVFMIKLPSTHKFKTLIGALIAVSKEITDQSRYSDALMTRFFMTSVSGCMPLNVLGPISGFDAFTFAFSNIPGVSKMEVFDGCVLEKIVPIAPNLKNMGVTIVVLSYDNRFQIGILIDKTLVESQKEVQKITDDILHNIKALAKEVKELFEKK